MNLGATDDSHREIESLRAQVSELQESLQKTTAECTAMTTRAEQEQARWKALATRKEGLEKQLKDLQSDLKTSKLLRSYTQLFLQEAISANEKGLSICKSFFILLGTIQEMHHNLSLNEQLLNNQKEELHMMMEVQRNVSEYQK